MSKFKVGDKVICIDRDDLGSDPLELGKVYEVISTHEFYISIDIGDGEVLQYYPRRFELAEQSVQECPYDAIDELEAQVENLEELVSDQAHQINQLTEALDYFTRLTHYFSTEGVGKLPNTKLGGSVVDAILDYFKGDFEKQFKPVREYTLEDWEQAIANDWVFETRCGEKVTIDLIDGEECNRPILCSIGWYHNINGMWNDTTGEDADDIIRRVS